MFLHKHFTLVNILAGLTIGFLSHYTPWILLAAIFPPIYIYLYYSKEKYDRENNNK